MKTPPVRPGHEKTRTPTDTEYVRDRFPDSVFRRSLFHAVGDFESKIGVCYRVAAPFGYGEKRILRKLHSKFHAAGTHRKFMYHKCRAADKLLNMSRFW